MSVKFLKLASLKNLWYYPNYQITIANTLASLDKESEFIQKPISGKESNKLVQKNVLEIFLAKDQLSVVSYNETCVEFQNWKTKAEQTLDSMKVLYDNIVKLYNVPGADSDIDNQRDVLIIELYRIKRINKFDPKHKYFRMQLDKYYNDYFLTMQEMYLDCKNTPFDVEENHNKRQNRSVEEAREVEEFEESVENVPQGPQGPPQVPQGPQGPQIFSSFQPPQIIEGPPSNDYAGEEQMVPDNEENVPQIFSSFQPPQIIEGPPSNDYAGEEQMVPDNVTEVDKVVDTVEIDKKNVLELNAELETFKSENVWFLEPEDGYLNQEESSDEIDYSRFRNKLDDANFDAEDYLDIKYEGIFCRDEIFYDKYYENIKQILHYTTKPIGPDVKYSALNTGNMARLVSYLVRNTPNTFFIDIYETEEFKKTIDLLQKINVDINLMNSGLHCNVDLLQNNVKELREHLINCMEFVNRATDFIRDVRNLSEDYNLYFEIQNAIDNVFQKHYTKNPANPIVLVTEKLRSIDYTLLTNTTVVENL